MNVTKRAQRDLNNLAGFVRRTGLTGWVRERNAVPQFERALRSVVAAEDELGVDAAAKLGDRLDDLRREAMDVGLLTPREVLDTERKVCL